jgi:hypothetical protein
MSARQRFPTEVMIGRDQLLLRVKLPGVSCRRCGSSDRLPAVGRSPSQTAREELRAPGIGRKAQQGSRLPPKNLGTGNWELGRGSGHGNARRRLTTVRP